MLLKSLTLHNFGTYKGSQTFDLSVSPERNVILIGGKNGAGKSTFLESLRLCFYGSAAFRGTYSRDKYERYLLDRIHRDPSVAIPPRAAAVEVEFDHADQDGTSTYKLVREWIRASQTKVNESISLKRNGEIVSDIDAQHWQDFIQELIPIGVSDLFFFDGEKVQMLADDGSDANTLSEAVSNLLGADLVERLGADLSIFRSRGLQKVDAEQNTLKEMQIQLDKLDSLRMDRVVAHREYELMSSKSAEIAAELENLEKELQRQGGSYAKNRGRLEERRKQISARVDSLESSLREHATGLLPIAFAPNLLKDVLKQLDLEQDIRFAVVVDESLSRAARLTLSNLRKIEVGGGGRTSRLGDRPEFIEIERIVKRTHQPSDIDAPMIHDLSGEQDRQIQSWATICLNTLPSELTALGKQLEDLYRERQKVERDLERIPHDEVLKPLLDKVQACRVEFAEKTASVGGKRAALEQLDQSIQTAEIAYKRAADVVASASSQRTSLDRAERAQSALREFKDALVRQKIRAVENELAICFNMLSRKHLKRTFSIDPVTFTVLLQDEQERIIPKSELSAGEKQIYAIAVLWALGRVAHRPAPIIIDTPLARLDSEHRSLIIKRYFPTVSHQVIILSTDTEIDRRSMSELESSIARSYELKFSSLDQATVVSRGYFEEDTQHEFS